MKWHFSVSLWIFILSLAHAADGTKSRQEIEFKKAYAFQAFSIAQIETQLSMAFKQRSKKLKLSKLLDSPYYLAREFGDFVFEDFYFDDDLYTLAHAGAAYRLRYRYDSRDKFMRYKLFPFIKDFYPHRCEVQFKKDYVQTKEYFTAEESRFEFRNASEPFVLKKDAPPAPWPISEFIDYAQSGKYKDYLMLPFEELKKIPFLDFKTFAPKLKLITNRYRTHFNIQNPWGNGPNPEQAFIISIDHVQIYQQNNFRGQFLELEVEIDRSILDKMVEAAKSSDQDISNYSIAALVAVKRDLKSIAQLMNEIMQQKLHLRSIEASSKYVRAWKML